MNIRTNNGKYGLLLIAYALAILLVILLSQKVPTVKPLSNNNESYVWKDNTYIIVGGDDKPLVLINNPEAIIPTYDQLLEFIQSDNTDILTYNNNFICADFAETLHNNAEKAGIKSAFVMIHLDRNAIDFNNQFHALNAFKTTDKGLVYIDDTCGENTIDLTIGNDYITKSLFKDDGQHGNMGKILSIDILQW